MAEAHDPAAHHGPNHRAYIIVFAALSVFTLASFLLNWATRQNWWSELTGAGLILGVAIVKAVLVAMIFMHLKWDWGKLYYLIIPAFILGAMMMMVLMPDIVLAWTRAVEQGTVSPAPPQ